MAENVTLTGTERTFGEDEIIVSKTDLKGHITYANDVFLRLYGGGEDEVLGKPHSLVRNPDMPRCIFKLLWDTLGKGEEIFAYVVNRSKNGDHYWVLAHVTPSRDASGAIVGYHSNRRVPGRKVLEAVIMPLYRDLLALEQSHSNRKEGMNAAYAKLMNILKEKGLAYDEFIFSLQD
ncbi:MAG: PAS domain-containing protein [Rhodospirillales bacterium]|nr:PAS domain-containing protein [Rhodospirillales bacterium]